MLLLPDIIFTYVSFCYKNNFTSPDRVIFFLIHVLYFMLGCIQMTFTILLFNNSNSVFNSALQTSLSPAFEVVGHIAPDEEKFVFSKLVVQFSFTYDTSRGLLYVSVYINHRFCIYCECKL